jgi:tRNA A-37 threonylcarbamoyl transferase component Bud32
MSFVEIAPRYRAALARRGLSSAHTFLDWPGVVLSGHPSRHVLRVEADADCFILKKEHRVPWRDRLAGVLAGFGWSSKSVREARLLDKLHAAGVPCPEVVAVGEHGSQAFLLLGEQHGMRDLRTYLAGAIDAAERRALAAALGAELARVHAAGFDQPDLYAKHILVRPGPSGFDLCFLDWQRSQLRRTVSWPRRLRDLAALDASLAERLASDRLRLVCLRAYMRGIASPPLREVVGAIRRASAELLKRRKIRELRQPPLPEGVQQLLWIQDEERLCIARDFHAELGGRLPSWLPQDPRPHPDGNCVEHRLILLGSGRTAHLIQRWRGRAAWLMRGKFPAPEFAKAAAIFRLQRFGVAAPRLLAMGHRHVGVWQRFSFLLIEPPDGESLESVLRRCNAPAFRQGLLRQLDTLMGKVHDAGYLWRTGADPLQACVVNETTLALANVEALEPLASWSTLTRKREAGDERLVTP